MWIEWDGMTQVAEFRLGDEESRDVGRLLDQLCSTEPIALDAFLHQAVPLSGHLPFCVRKLLYDLKLTEMAPGVLIRTNPIVSERCGPTPNSIPSPRRTSATREEVLHILYASLLGEVFAWESIQSG